MERSICVVEDDQATALLLSDYLAELGFSAIHYHSAEPFLSAFPSLSTAFLILDVGLPGISGIEICRRIRALGSNIPICILSSRSQEVDVVLGLESGADDYVTNPIRKSEFIARVRALLRRAEVALKTRESDEFQIGPLCLRENRIEITLNGTLLDLTKTEFALLRHLILSRGGVCTEDPLLASVWGYHSSAYEGTLGTHISRLRLKLKPTNDSPELIQTVWGVGYRLLTAESPSEV